MKYTNICMTNTKTVLELPRKPVIIKYILPDALDFSTGLVWFGLVYLMAYQPPWDI